MSQRMSHLLVVSFLALIVIFSSSPEENPQPVSNPPLHNYISMIDYTAPGATEQLAPADVLELSPVSEVSTLETLTIDALPTPPGKVDNKVKFELLPTPVPTPIPAAPMIASAPAPAAPAPAPAPPAPAPAPVDPGSGWVGLAMSQINNSRATYGLGPLAWNDQVAAVAQAHANDQLRNNYYSHLSLNGSSRETRLRNGGVSFTNTGENQCHYYGKGITGTMNWCHSIFMAEPFPGHWNHIANILDRRWTRVGVGVASDGYHVIITWNFVK